MLKQQIQNDTKQSMKSGDQFVVGVLRMLSSVIGLKEKDLRYKQKLEKEPELSDEQVVEVVSSEIKKRKDAIALYQQGNRLELAEKEQKEIEVLKKYLPEQLPQEELQKIIQATIDEISARGGSALGGKDMGKVMAELTPKIKGRADGGEVSKIVKELLTVKIK